MLKSWRQRVIVLLIGILISAGVFLILTFNGFKYQINQTVLKGNDDVCEKWTMSVDSRLNMLYEHIYDFLVNLYNNSEWSLDGDKSYQATRKMIDFINNKQVISNDLTAFFMFDSDTDTFLFSSNSYVSYEDSTELKPYLRAASLDDTSFLVDKNWSVRRIANRDYFYKAVRLGRYTVGAVSYCSLYDIDASFELFGEESSSFLVYNNEIYSNENDSYSNLLDFNSMTSSMIKDYAVSIRYDENIESYAVIVAKPQRFLQSLDITRMLLITDALVCVILITVLIFYMDKRIAKPINRLMEANREVAKGNLDYRLDVSSSESTEFADLYQSFNDMTAQIGALTIESYDMKLKEEENRLTMLRAQVKPHTFLNGITTINNMTYKNDPETIRQYIAAFAQFTRYMLHTDFKDTTVREEINHIKNYVNMQKLRFPNSIEVSYRIQEEVEEERIPFLMLYSLVENSFKHAMTLYETLQVTIIAERYEEEGFKGIRLIEEDDGDGFSEEALLRISNYEKDDMITTEHLGLKNVFYTMNLMYGRKGLMRISNKPDKGAKVELLIPERKDTNETVSM